MWLKFLSGRKNKARISVWSITTFSTVNMTVNVWILKRFFSQTDVLWLWETKRGFTLTLTMKPFCCDFTCITLGKTFQPGSWKAWDLERRGQTRSWKPRPWKAPPSSPTTDRWPHRHAGAPSGKWGNCRHLVKVPAMYVLVKTKVWGIIRVSD